MPNRNVPPRRPAEDGRWDDRSGSYPRQRDHEDGYGRDGYGERTQTGRGGQDRSAYGDRAGYGDTSYGDQGYRHQYGPYSDGRAREGQQQYAPASPPRRGPQWVGPQGVPAPGGGYGYEDPTGSDYDEDDAPVGRRRALAVLGGTAAVAVGGAALALTPQGRGIVSDLFGDGDQVDVTADQLNAAIGDTPAGQQPSTVRTYTEQNESYMGSRAGNELRKNSPQDRSALRQPERGGAPTPRSPSRRCWPRTRSATWRAGPPSASTPR